MKLTDAEKKELRGLLANASPGPWKAINLSERTFPSVEVGPERRHSDDSGSEVPRIVINASHDPRRTTAGASMPTFQATAKLIAFLRNHAEAMLDD